MDVSEIKKAYFELAKLYHPDVHQSGVGTNAYEVSENFLVISEAYDVLSNAEMRDRYD